MSGEGGGEPLFEGEAGAEAEFAGGAGHVQVQVAAHQVDAGRGEGGVGAGGETGEEGAEEAAAATRPVGGNGEDARAAAGQAPEDVYQIAKGGGRSRPGVVGAAGGGRGAGSVPH